MCQRHARWFTVVAAKRTAQRIDNKTFRLVDDLRGKILVLEIGCVSAELFSKCDHAGIEMDN